MTQIREKAILGFRGIIGCMVMRVLGAGCPSLSSNSGPDTAIHPPKDKSVGGWTNARIIPIPQRQELREKGGGPAVPRGTKSDGLFACGILDQVMGFDNFATEF
jgi:hypothetical protein